MFAKRKTPKEISESHDHFEKHEWLLTANTDEIFRFFGHTAMDSHNYKSAAFALKIRLSKDAEVQSKRIVYFTVGIFFLTFALVALTVVLIFKT